MASRKRDYKAEYARAKAKANAAGYKSQREYRAARKEYGLTGRISPVPVTVRNHRRNMDAQAWSDRHSKTRASRFNPRWPQDRKDIYWEVYLGDRDWTLKSHRDLLRQLLVPRVYSNAEFNERYTG